MMLGEIFKMFLITSLAGSVLAGIISLLRPATKRIFGYSWHYYIWLCVLFVMLVPVRFNIDTETVTGAAIQRIQTVQTGQPGGLEQTQTNKSDVQNKEQPKTFVSRNKLVNWNKIEGFLAGLWLFGAFLLILSNVLRYSLLIFRIHKNAETVKCPEIADYTSKEVEVKMWKNAASPFMAGVFKPMLVMPETELSKEQLHNILRHEMTHFKRHDILYKWFAELVKCLHWFNPAAWYVSKQIAEECEISCDMQAIKNMSHDEEKSYINTILFLLQKGKSKPVLLTTQMTGGKKDLKRRFNMIKNKRRVRGYVSAVSFFAAIIMMAAAVFASGVLSGCTSKSVSEKQESANAGDLTETSKKEQPFSEDEVAAAKSVVEEYFKAANEKGKRGELKTLTAWHDKPNTVLTSDGDAILTLKDIRYDADDAGRGEYVKDGMGSVNNVSVDNVIVFRVDYNVSAPEGGDIGAYNEGDYSDWKMILIRDGKNGKWLIDDMGY